MLALLHRARRPKNLAASVALLLVVLLIASPAGALLINLNEVSSGQAYPFPFGAAGSAGGAPSTVAGTGTLAGVMNAAADYWEGIFTGPGTLNIDYGWDPLSTFSSGTLGVASQFNTRDFSGAGKDGLIRFNNTRSDWFVDGTPLANTEYLSFAESSADLGGGTMVTGRDYFPADGALFSTFDLYSVALHEIGHLLGMTDLGEAAFDSGDGTLDITSGPFSGAVIPVTIGSGHIDPSSESSLAQALLTPSISNGRRKLASDADIAAIAELSGFTSVNYSAAVAAIPEPSQILAFGLLAAAGGLRAVARR